MTDHPILTVDRLNVGFASRQGVMDVLHGVSFELHRGRTTCIVGESGSGKSVTARTILNMVPRPGIINGGRILFDPEGTGRPTVLTDLDPRGREIRAIRGGRIGMIFQEPMSSLSPVHTIGNQIVEAVRLHRDCSKAEAREIARDMLEQVEIPQPEKALDKYAFEYSGGMRQRAMIAMALSCHPDVLIADEPTTALDVTTQAEILDLMRKLQDELHMAIMFITHDMGVVAEIADQVVVMEKGHVVEQGGVEQIFTAPRHRYTRKLLGAVKRLEEPATEKRRPAKAAGPVLKVQDLALHFEKREGFLQRVTDTVRAVDGVSFTLHEGEALGIVGESGSGKTTVGRCIARVYDPQGGVMDYRGQDLMAAEGARLRESRREVRMIFQDPFASLNPRMTVKQLIAEPLIVNGLASGQALEDRVAKLLTDVGLDPGMMERYPHAFSGGQRQRIVVARAIALDPKVVIADEPTSALDVSIRTQVLDLLLKLQADLGLSFIFISHDMAVIRYFCDRVAVMFRGRIVEIGETEQIITDPQHPYTRALLSSVPIADPTLRGTRTRHRYHPETA
ncbi:ABC transporter ATP-binding protein [Pseudoponticoccus marisrubri]|uniref:ABC transporter ATP-binding protein n=1 Tax=Pseudoponticoccus marisrubri TaxID=1685382 RepID=A0A0W7WLX6_9RHOB|nr:ABC transporter ATP-binding protein [Pseudoponticoccus marisrubri]KUF11543.1 ABC transporter ATP-binding protein [Pseudoponticoccus marisrubri]